MIWSPCVAKVARAATFRRGRTHALCPSIHPSIHVSLHPRSNGHAGAAQALASGGASRSAKTSLGYTPLHLAESNGHIAVVTILEHGNDDDDDDHRGDGDDDDEGAGGYFLGDMFFVCF